MIRFPRSPILFALLMALPALPAAAHDFWIEPARLDSAAVRSGGDGESAGVAIAISFREGHGDGHPLPRNDSRLERFEVLGPDGERRAVPGVDGAHPAGVLRRLAPGLHIVGYLNNPAPHRLPAERFERYLEEEGLERIARLRRRRGEKRLEGRERFYRCAKTMIRIGELAALSEAMPASRSAAPISASRATEPALDPIGLPLELVPEADPTLLGPGDRLPVRLLFRGEPVASALVKVFASNGRESGETIPRRLRTDRDGRVEIELDHPGRWRLAAVHMIEADPELRSSGIDWESWWASLTFTVPPGGSQASPSAATAAASRSSARRQRRR